jgi:alpha-galactosidase
MLKLLLQKMFDSLWAIKFRLHSGLNNPIISGFSKSLYRKAFIMFLLLSGVFFNCWVIAGEINGGANDNTRGSIAYDDERHIFLIRMENSSYAFGEGARGLLFNLHWGGMIENINDIPEAPTSLGRGGMYRFEYAPNAEYVRMLPSLKIDQPDQLLHLKLGFDSHKIDGNHLRVALKADNYPFYIYLHYQIYPGLDIIDRWVEVKNEGKETVHIENIQSAVWYIPHSHKYRLTHFAGNWGKEWQMHREFIGAGQKVLESRTGMSGPFHVPYFALDKEGLATEKAGILWFGALQWSGDWKMIIEQDSHDQVHVSGGYNDFDFTLKLGSNESHSTPVFTAGYTCGGFGEASRILHRYQKKYLYPENMFDVEVPVVYNTYGSLSRKSDHSKEIFMSGVNEENVIALIPLAARVGVEMFIIDDGWQTAIGDWTVDKNKFPKGLKPVIDEVHRHGMKFGLWIEPERVFNNSKLYEEKEEWLFAKTKSEGWQSKNVSSAMLNLSRPDVLEYVYEVISDLLRENDISYLKLDFNRFFEVPVLNDRRSMRTKYVENFYKLWERLEKEFPDVFFENCASGHGRPDLKMDDYFARINRSDNQDPVDCILLQEGFTYLHPPYMAGGAGHISYTSTSWNGRHNYAPLDFMAHIGMMGWLASTLSFDEMTDEELVEVKGYFDLFKKIRHITCRGELHRIASLREHNYAAFQFVLPDSSESLLFAFGHGMQFRERIPDLLLESLNPDLIYDIEVYGKQRSVEDNSKPMYLGSMTGQALMELGVRVDLRGDYDSCIFHFKKSNKVIIVE